MSNELDLKRFIVDDWGISPAVNEAALYLAERGYLYGISVIPYSRFADYKLQEILRTGVQVGCHVNLTFNTEPALHSQRLSWTEIFLRIVTSMLRTILPSGRKRLFEKVSGQADWVRKQFGRLDYLDGHHHIHLYPGILGTTQKVASQFQVPFRIISDTSFRSNFALGEWAKLVSKKTAYFECLYLGLNDLSNDTKLKQKIENEKGLPVAIHPATQNDFAENKVDDHFIEGRVYQFLRLKEALKI